MSDNVPNFKINGIPVFENFEVASSQRFLWF